jgi:hypothetical protein
MTINPANYKWYQSAVWSATGGNGGAINLSATITGSIVGNTFATVSRADAITGTTNYRKIYFRNEDAVTFPSAKAFISATCSSTFTSLYMAYPTATTDTQTQATAYTWYQAYASSSTLALSLGDIATTSSTGIWLKMVVQAGTPGYDANSFKISVIDTY